MIRVAGHFAVGTATLLACSVLQAGSPQVQQPSQPWKVDGVVTNSSGPVANATVSASGPGNVRRAQTDSNGLYALEGAVPGNYIILPESDHAGKSRAASVNVADGDHKVVDFKLYPEGIISGRVLDAQKVGVQGVSVSAWVKTYQNGRLRFEPKAHSSTDDEGNYRIVDLAEGKYYLMVIPKPLVAHKYVAHKPVPAKTQGDASAVEQRKLLPALPLNTFYPGVPTYEGAVPIVLRAGEQREGTDIVLRRAASLCVHGNVVGDRNALVYVTFYQIVGDSFPQMAKGTTLPSEPFEVCGMTPGSYRALAITMDLTTQTTTSYAEADFYAEKIDVDLGELAPTPGLPIRGSVQIDDASREQKLPEGLSVMLSGRGRPFIPGENLSALVPQSGSFSIANVFGEEYGLLVSGLPPGYYVRSASQQGRDLRQNALRPGAGDLTVILASDGATVGGKVVGKDGKPVPGATVVLLSKVDNQAQSRTSDGEGEFRFLSQLPPGQYTLAAFSGLFEGEELDPEFLLAHLTGADGLDLSPSATLRVSPVVQEIR